MNFSQTLRRSAATLISLLMLMHANGCGPYAEIQKDLVTQSREGLRRVELARRADADVVAQALEDRRRRLDDAFDLDVRGQDELTADFVIESRRAYAAGLVRLTTSKAQHEAASATAADNAAAADEALALLDRMLTSQSKFPTNLLKGSP